MPVAKKALDTKLWKFVSQKLRGTRDYELAARAYSDTVAPRAQVLVYFADTHTKFYQLQQWLPILEKLNEVVPTAIVLRRPSAIHVTSENTSLPIVFRRKFDEFMSYMTEYQPKLVLYVNNGVSNFQSLSFAPAVHVHINHGESDKLSMVSNQAKAYDKIFTAGPAARHRHRKALFDFDESHLAEVGRPQLDLEHIPSLPPSTLRTILYAPTWEGENDNNNYTSVDCYGLDIVKAALAHPGCRLVYKPHPRIADSKHAGMAENHARILELISEANAGGGQHIVSTEGDILTMFDQTDLMVTDISSVGLDFLYLHGNKPILLTDRRTDRAALIEESPIASAVPIIDADSLETLPEVLSEQLTTGGDVDARAKIRRFYFGDLNVGDSSRAFIAEVQRLIDERAQQQRQTGIPDSAAEAGDDPA